MIAVIFIEIGVYFVFKLYPCESVAILTQQKVLKLRKVFAINKIKRLQLLNRLSTQWPFREAKQDLYTT